MKKRTNAIASIIIFLGLFTYSCQTSNELIPDDSSVSQKGFDKKLFSKYQTNFNDETIKSDYTVIDGTVHFKNQESFKNVMNNLGEFKKGIVKYKNFISSETYLKNLMISLSESKTEFEKNRTIQENDDYLSIIDNKVQFRKDLSLAPFTDREGAFYIGNVLFLLYGNNQFIIYDGDKRKIDNIKSGVIHKDFVQQFSKNNANSKVSSLCRGLLGYGFDNNGGIYIFVSSESILTNTTELNVFCDIGVSIDSDETNM